MSNEEADYYWPGIADLFLGLLIVLAALFLMSNVARARAALDFRAVRHAQGALLDSIASVGRRIRVACGDTMVVIVLDSAGACTASQAVIRARADAQVQGLSFSTEVLFSQNDYKLSETGRYLMSGVGRALWSVESTLVEIQIVGHADSDPTRRFESNLQLAGLRAMEVFDFLQTSAKLDPNRVLMSAATFGEYSPVGRVPGAVWTSDSLRQKNSTREAKELNRRIELRITYRRAR